MHECYPHCDRSHVRYFRQKILDEPFLRCYEVARHHEVESLLVDHVVRYVDLLGESLSLHHHDIIILINSVR